jgi:hypothetical protein
LIEVLKRNDIEAWRKRFVAALAEAGAEKDSRLRDAVGG